MKDLMKQIKDLLEESENSKNLTEVATVQIKMASAHPFHDLLLETLLAEGKWVPDGQYMVRMDKRPDNQGGHQLHILGPKKQQWAFRHDGSRSERSKYNLATTNKIRALAAKHLGKSPDLIECEIVGDDNGRLIVEATIR